jgi:hypothetical protein
VAVLGGVDTFDPGETKIAPQLRKHDGVVIALRSNVHRCSDHFERLPQRRDLANAHLVELWNAIAYQIQLFVLLRLTFCSHRGVFGEIQRGNNRKEAEVDHQRARPDRPPVFTRYPPPIDKNFTQGSSTKPLSPTTFFWFVTALTKIFMGHVTVPLQ